MCPIYLLAAHPVPTPATSCAKGRNKGNRKREKDKRAERKNTKWAEGKWREGMFAL